MSTDLEPYRTEGGDLVTTGDVRQDLRNRTTDSWTDVVADVALLASNIAPTDFVPKGLRNNAPAVTGAIMYGREVGLPPMTALQVLHNIEGRVSMSSEGQRALVLQAGHEVVVVESTSAKCTIKGRRKGSQEWTQTTWTIDDARQAGLVRKDNWTKYPKAMLVARASADLCRLAFPDVIRGLMAVEELEDVVAITGGEVVGASAEPTQVQRKTRKKAAPAKKADAPDEPLPEDEAATQTGAESDESTGAGDAPSEDPDSAPPLPEDAPTSSGKNSPTENRESGGESDGSGGSDGATPSTPSSTPEPSPDPDGAFPADVVDDEAEAAPRVTKPQLTKMAIQFNVLGVTDKTERLFTTNVLIGRTVESSTALTMKEAMSVIDTLESCKTREDLEAIVSATADRAEQNGGA